MKTRVYASLIILCAGLLPNSIVFAEKFPLSSDELKKQADAIVVGTIEGIRVESERSHIEKGFGNYDWGIYLTLRLEMLEKGNIVEDSLEARCFRIRSRKGYIEYLTPSGHHPIPAIGELVRVHLEKEAGSWSVVLPNGITSVDDFGDWPGGNLQDAKEVRQLRSRGYTYLLPVEIWLFLIVLAFVLVTVALAVRWVRTRPLRQRPSTATEQVLPSDGSRIRG